MHDEGTRPPRPGRRLLLRSLAAALVIITGAAAATATASLLEIKGLVDAFDRPGSKIRLGSNVITKAEAGDPQTILLIGSDHRYGAAGNDARSDTIILARLDPDAPATTVMSVPRDLKVDIRRRNGAIQTDKINAAYSIGGPALTTKVVKKLLGIKINHVININFRGFRDAVNYIGCVYTDVDRRYYHSNVGLAPSQQYAEIDVRPGYQKLCGTKALEYVRFRHQDSDIVRSARQQGFLAQAKQQYGVQNVIKHRKQLAHLFGRFTQSDADLHSTDAVLKLLTLAIFSANHPIHEVHFPAILSDDPNDTYVTASPVAIHKAVRQFMGASHAGGGRPHPRRKAGARRRAQRHREQSAAASSGSSGLIDGSSLGAANAALLAPWPKMAVFYPTQLAIGSSYLGPESNTGPAPNNYPRSYHIRDQNGRRHPAYRIVAATGFVGQYYGIQGTTWKDPPLLENPSEVRRVGGRRLELFFDGKHLRLVAWRSNGAVYWVSNTLLETLSNPQMLGIAASFKRLRQPATSQ